MTTTYHTPYAIGGALTSAAMEAPLSQLDTALATVIAAGSSTATTLTAQANSGQASLVVASSAGFVVGDHVYIGNGTAYETRIVSAIPDGTHITVSVNLTSTYAIGKPVSKSPVEIVDARAGMLSLAARLAAMEGAVNVLAYGADPSGATSSATAFQAAHDALPATGGTIFIPPGTYLGPTNASLLTPTKSGVRLVGAGRGATVLKYAANGTTSAENLLNATANNLTDLYFGHFTIDGNSANNPSLVVPEGIRSVGTGCARLTVEDVYIHHIKGAPANESFAINVGNCTGVVIRGVYVSDCGGSGIAISGADDVLISDCQSINNGWMGFTISTNTVQSHRLVMANCIARANTMFGFNFEGVEYGTLASLLADANGSYGFVFGGSGVVGLVNSHHFTGVGLVAMNNGFASSGGNSGSGLKIVGDGTSASAHDIDLRGVIATDTRAVGSKQQAYGFDVAGGCDNISVAGDCRGNRLAEGDPGTNGRIMYLPNRIIRGKITKSGTQSLTSGVTAVLTWDTEDLAIGDSDGLHATSSAALTGMVSKTSGSPTLTGTGTAFLTELSVGQVIDIPGGATERKVVRSIASNTSLTLWTNAANSASGQTATRVNTAFTIPAGLGKPVFSGWLPLWRIAAVLTFTSNPNGYREIQFLVNGVAVEWRRIPAVNGADTIMEAVAEFPLSDGDYVEIAATQTSGGALTVQSSGSHFDIRRIG